MSRFGPTKLIGTPQDVARLGQQLSQCSEVTRYDAGEHKEAMAGRGAIVIR